jgi:hypothetical protein
LRMRATNHSRNALRVGGILMLRPPRILKPN